MVFNAYMILVINWYLLNKITTWLPLLLLSN